MYRKFVKEQKIWGPQALLLKIYESRRFYSRQVHKSSISNKKRIQKQGDIKVYVFKINEPGYHIAC